MSLDQLFGKPVPMIPDTTRVPEVEAAPEPDELINETMSTEELERVLMMIHRKRRRLDIVGAEVGSDRVVTQGSLLTGD